MYRFGEWLRRERLEHGWSQVKLAGETSQAAISDYERNRSLPSILDVQILATSREQTLGSIPCDEFDLRTEKKRNWSNLKQERFDLAELPLADSVRTFDGKIYQLHGRIAIEQESKETQEISQLYYRIRTVVGENQVIAKRKHPDDELIHVSSRKLVHQ
ncbi:helix-turn-helix transcriptional regulator [Exiguobacterium sp.]|uniref:helix-turn-helix domain-containing protein n=1 Tax=Exiguobacterium sp. TaxID=44751 RepID=UPI0028AD258A|nr:helix-turn-helix transcriptional regulator [Exiguobacterium sp.]